MEIKEYDLFEMIINADLTDEEIENLGLGVDTVSFVKDPALQVEWLKLGKDNSQKSYAFQANEDKQILTAPLLIPDKPIYRNDINGEYFVTINSENIERANQLFHQNLNNKNVNEDHSQEKQVPAVMVESWIVDDPKIDKSASLGFSLPKGSWVASYKVTDKQYWNENIKNSNDLTGFSIEGSFPVEFIGQLLQKFSSDEKAEEEKVEKIKELLELRGKTDDETLELIKEILK